MEFNAEKKTFIVIILTLITMFAEIVFGYHTKSMALLADGWHMGTHVLALSVTFFTYILIRKFANSHSFVFGTGKFSTLSGFASSLLLGLTGLFIIFESIERFFNPLNIGFNEAIIVAIIGLVVNSCCILIMGYHKHGNCHHYHCHDGDDFNFKAAYMHILADAMTSVFAITALIIAKYFGWIFLDSIVGTIGGVIICIWAYGLIKSTSMILLDSEAKEIKSKVTEMADFKSLHIWKIADDEYALIAGVSEGTDISALKNKLCEIADFDSITIETIRNEEHQ